MSAADIAQLLEDEAFGTLATDIFIGGEPVDPNDVVTVYDTGGTYVSYPQLRSPTVQIRVRAVNYATGFATASAIRDLLIDEPSRTINATTYHTFTVVNDVAKIGRDDSNRELFTVNLQYLEN